MPLCEWPTFVSASEAASTCTTQGNVYPSCTQAALRVSSTGRTFANADSTWPAQVYQLMRAGRGRRMCKWPHRTHVA